MDKVRVLAGLVAVMGCLILLPESANATPVTIDEIIFEQQGGAVNSSVLKGTADFSVSGSTLTIVLTNTSTAATGGGASTNLLDGIGFNLPSLVTIANNAATNSVAITGPPSGPLGTGSIAVGFTAPITDDKWGAGNAPLPSINNITVLGDVNASAATLQAQIDFDLAGNLKPPPPGTANVDGPDFGLLTKSVLPTTCGGLQCVQDSVTLTLALAGTVPANLISLIDSGHVVLSFGSPNTSAGAPTPEPATIFLTGTALVGLGYFRKRLFGRANGEPAVS